MISPVRRFDRQTLLCIAKERQILELTRQVAARIRAATARLMRDRTGQRPPEGRSRN
jgi:hypothetical protein